MNHVFCLHSFTEVDNPLKSLELRVKARGDKKQVVAGNVRVRARHYRLSTSEMVLSISEGEAPQPLAHTCKSHKEHRKSGEV